MNQKQTAMDLKLKNATIVNADTNTLTVILSIEKIKTIERVISVDKSEKEDFWTSISVGGKVFDVNFWLDDLKNVYMATLYATKNNGKFLETVTNYYYSSCFVKAIPLNEYRLMNK